MPDALALYDGDLVQRATRWSDLCPAERKRRAAEAARDRNVPELWALAEAHLVLRGRSGSRLSPRTAEAYSDSIRFFVRDTVDRSILHLTSDEAAVWVRGMEAAGKSASTCQVRLAGARCLYRALRWSGATEADPFADIRPAKDRTAPWDKRSPYREDGLDKLLAVATGDMLLVVLLGSHAGMRVSEMVDLTWPDIDWTGRRLHIRHGKGDKARYAPASSTLLVALERERRETGPVLSFKNGHAIRWAMRQLCARAGTPYLAIHSLRHAMGSRLYAETGKLEIVQRALGHSDISTTQVYTHWSDDTITHAVDGW